MARKNNIDWSLFDKYEWTGAWAAKLEDDGGAKYLKQDIWDLKRELSIGPSCLMVLKIYQYLYLMGIKLGTREVHLRYSLGTVEVQLRYISGTVVVHAFKKLCEIGILQASPVSQSVSQSFSVAPPFQGSRSAKRSSVKKITTNAGETVKGANDSPSQDRVKDRTDLQIIVDDYYKVAVKHYLGVDLGNIYKDGKALGLIKKMLDQHGLENTKKIFMGAAFGYVSGNLPFIVEAKMSIGAIFGTKQDCLVYYEQREGSLKDNRVMEAGEDGVHEGHVSA